MLNNQITQEELLTQSQHRLIEEVEQRKNLELLLRSQNEELKQQSIELHETNEELKITHEQLLQSEKLAAIGQLAAGVAHEINNPISYVKSNLSVMEDYFYSMLSIAQLPKQLIGYIEKEVPDSHAKQNLITTANDSLIKADLDQLLEDLPDILSETSEGVSRVAVIVKELRDFSHVSEKVWERVDIHKAIDAAINVANYEVKHIAKITKNYDFIPMIKCIPLQVEQVIMNFLLNAAQSMSEYGEIEISTKNKNKFVEISISDTGCGIRKENIKHLFEPFYTTKPVGVGTGLGLSVSYTIVKAHGGKISVESIPGTGTTMTFTLLVNQNKN